MNETVDMQVFAVRSLLCAVPVYETDSSPSTSAHVPQKYSASNYENFSYEILVY